MTVEEAQSAINSLKKRGMTDEQIAKSLYVMYKENKIDLEQLDALARLVGYTLTDGYIKKETKPKTKKPEIKTEETKKTEKPSKKVESKASDEAKIGLEYCEKGDLRRGIIHLRIAAEKNNLEAITNLGHALKLIGNYEESFKWTLKAAQRGQKIAISNLAIMYKIGQGVECSAEESAKWGKKLVELGEIDEGYNTIISAYTYVRNEKLRDYKKAFKYALEGSKRIMEDNPKPEQGDPCETVVQLALCYGFGRGVKKSEKEALKYYDYCCHCGLGIALYNSACIYAYPEDKKLYDITKAIKYYKASAKVGYTDGYYELAYLYHDGEKVEKNLEFAKYFYAKAIRLGNGEQHYEDAIENLKDISEYDAERVASGKFSLLID